MDNLTLPSGTMEAKELPITTMHYHIQNPYSFHRLVTRSIVF